MQGYNFTVLIIKRFELFLKKLSEEAICAYIAINKKIQRK